MLGGGGRARGDETSARGWVGLGVGALEREEAIQPHRPDHVTVLGHPVHLPGAALPLHRLLPFPEPSEHRLERARGR